MVDIVQLQIPDYVGSYQRAQANQDASRMNQLKILAGQQELQTNAAKQSLYKLASAGDSQAMQQLSMLAPEAAKGLRDYQAYQAQRSGQLANSVLTAPAPARPQVYQQVIADYTKEFGRAPNIPSEYSPEAEQYLKSIVTRAREVEDVAKEQQSEYTTEETAQGLKIFNKKTGQFEEAQIGGQRLGVYQKPPSTVVNVGGEQPAFRKKLEEQYGESVAKRLDQIQTNADNAIETKQYLNLQRESLKNLPDTGVLDNAKIFLGNLANQAGVDIDMSKVSSLEQLKAAGNTITIPLVKKLGYNPTDADARLIGSTIANIGKGKATNEQLINLLDQATDKSIKKADIAESLRQQGKEQNIPAALRKYDLENPLKITSLRIPSNITPDAIDATARKYNMTREEVIRKLQEKGVR